MEQCSQRNQVEQKETPTQRLYEPLKIGEIQDSKTRQIIENYNNFLAFWNALQKQNKSDNCNVKNQSAPNLSFNLCELPKNLKNKY